MGHVWHMIKIGSLFSGIGGFELGIERAIPNAQTVWQVEQDKFCQSILAKHWPHAQRFDDVHDVGAHNLKPVHILCGGFPCQNISLAGNLEGIHGEKSCLWFEMGRIIGELRPRIIMLENVANIINGGLHEVLTTLAAHGYDAEWCNLSARELGAPHIRQRWFCIAYSNNQSKPFGAIDGKAQKLCSTTKINTHNTNSERQQEHTTRPKPVEPSRQLEHTSCKNGGVHTQNYWQAQAPESGLCDLDDGIPNRVAKLRALGNAIVPQCAEYVAAYLLTSGLIDDLL